MQRAVTLAVAVALLCACEKTPSKSGRDAGVVKDAAAEAGKPDAEAPDAGASDAGASSDPLPPSASPEMTARAKHLLEAVAHDNADLAVDMLFPRDAYLATRDSADPGKAWDNKVKPSFAKSVHTLHKRTQGIEKAQFSSLELGRNVEQLRPKKRDFKLPLWRVKHSRLNFVVDGRSQRIEVAEMVGWHGAWYVTRLR